MKYLVSWDYRFNGTAAENEESGKRGLAVFAQWTPPASATYHVFVGRIDGGGGFALVETDDPMDIADVTGKFGFIADYQVFPVVDIAEAAGALQNGVEFRAAI
ncbi:DUF3303 family protein [Mycobacterium sp. OTB74]|uniref:DUF3303 domain-containing protein n=1 Tax=Mycobacterium sp. OTB74 TaxID=1853452 RepID=UPI002473EFA9|nr:DUF3303 family protein [Mycobacterium sp. OTB74]MDH6243521.1 hypothetical protein [Mycobacterium sp. OTB74]